jgi:hypothetical protein
MYNKRGRDIPLMEVCVQILRSTLEIHMVIGSWYRRTLLVVRVPLKNITCMLKFF